jgi:hypothetical protein
MRLNQFFNQWIFYLLISVTLMACGGGGSDSADSSFLISAGPDVTVNEGETVVLTGEANQGGSDTVFTYSWSAPTSEIIITQEDSASAAASFVAPKTTESLIFLLTLTATDPSGGSQSDTVQITVVPVNALPLANIEHNQFSGETLAEYPAGTHILLSGMGSSDSDAPEGSPAIASYQWQQTSGVLVLEGLALTSDSLAFTAPILSENSVLGFQLTVTDQEGGMDTKSIDLNILSESNTLPDVDAGKDHQVFSGELILLQGEVNVISSAALPIQVNWIDDSGIVTQVDQTDSLNTFAVAPEVTVSQQVTFNLQVIDNFGNQTSDGLLVTISPQPVIALNDTGVIQQASQSSVGENFQAAFPGQDGQRGNDAIAKNTLLEKAGQGEAGFDFTLLNEIGDPVDEDSTQWTCVRDNVTGLIWEVKTNDGGSQDSDNSYSWYTVNNGEGQGSINGVGTSCTLPNCNTLEYVNHINSIGLCGFFDWRVPSHNELLSIIHFGKTDGVVIDQVRFPNTLSEQTGELWYWTSQSSADGVNGDAGLPANAWVYDFTTGNDNFINKSTPAYIRLVRAGR